MVKRISQLLFAAVMAAGLFVLGFCTDVTFVIVAAAVLSLGTPRRFVWITLAMWGFYFAIWSGYELLLLLRESDEKFGWMFIPYGIGALVFGLAAWFSARGVSWTFGKHKPTLRA